MHAGLYIFTTSPHPYRHMERPFVSWTTSGLHGNLLPDDRGRPQGAMSRSAAEALQLASTSRHLSWRQLQGTSTLRRRHGVSAHGASKVPAVVRKRLTRTTKLHRRGTPALRRVDCTTWSVSAAHGCPLVLGSMHNLNFVRGARPLEGRSAKSDLVGSP